MLSVPVPPALRRLLSVAVLVALAGGCAESSDQPTPPAPLAAPSATRLVPAAPSVHLDTTAREPMLLVHPDGSLFVAGYQRENPVVEQPPALWKSVDAGATWERVDVGTLDEGAIGNSDVDLALAPDGRIYFATMGFDRSVGVGTHVAVGVSIDGGTSWSWRRLTDDRGVDRPWVAIDPDGVAHVIWNDGRGVAYTRSVDGGSSWAAPEKIAPRGGSSHLVVGPDGELAVRVTPLSASGAQRDDDAEWILVSDDGGRSWQRRTPPGSRVFEGITAAAVPRWVEPLAWDASGALFYLWSEGEELWLGRSPDQGTSWESWIIARDDEAMYYPYLIAGGAGALAATWFSGRAEELAAHVALINASAGGQPEVTPAEPFQPDTWAADNGGWARDPAGEYLPVVFLATGGLAVASPIQDPADDRYGFAYRRWEIR